MNIVFYISAFLAAIVSAAYLQLPTFILALGYRWFHNYKIKRWFFRILSFVFVMLFVANTQSLAVILIGLIPILFFLIFSLLNANPKVYISLSEKQILKLKETDYPLDTEVLGFDDEQGNSICYPLYEMIKPRHILNDTFQNKPILVSYCMACRSAMVYNPLVKGQRLHFDVLGVYRRNMVMMDRETGTIWQQGTGEAIFGTLKGSQMEILPYQQTTLSEWLKQFPNSFIAKESNDVKDGIFSKERLMKMMKVTETLVTPGKTQLDGLPLRETVFGIELNGYSKAYPISELKKRNEFTDKLGETELSIKYDPQTNFINIIESKSGKIIPAQSHWWFGWKEFHPETEIWKAK
mgnify:CR=1 FL=1